MRRIVALAAVASMTVIGCGGGEGGPEISDARVGQPTGPNAALYLSASGDDADRLIAAETVAAMAVELHETTMGDDGTMGMRPVESLDLPAGGSLVLEPGSFHLMLVDAERMEVGDIIEVTLRWENAGEMQIEAEVVDPADTMGHDS